MTVHTTVARALLETIPSYGVSVVFGIPGTHNVELYRPLEDLGIRAVTTRHEQGAGYAADGWAQRTGLPGVVITTSGPGLKNAMSAIGTAACESRPLLVISPGPARGEEFADRGALHDTRDSIGMVGSIALWSRRVTTEAEALESVHEAFALFASERPQPVHLEVPLDLLEEAATSDAAQRLARELPVSAVPAVAELEAAARELAAAASPVIVAGGGACGASAEIVRLAEAIQAPVVTTMNGKGVVPESHPLSLGANIRLASVREFAESGDVVLVVGSRLGAAELWDVEFSPNGRTIRIDIDDDMLRTNLSPDVALRGDARAVLEALAAKVSELRVAGMQAERSAELERVRVAADREARELAPDVMTVAERIAEALPRDAVIATDSSQVNYLGIASSVRSERPREFLYMPTYATLGYGLPAAIGASIANPDRTVVAVLGDGALMFSVNELATAMEQGIDLVVLCVDNGGYAEIAQNQLDAGAPRTGVRLHQPDWVKLAEAFGATGIRADVAVLDEAVQAAISAGGVALVHVTVASPALAD